jgi:hypothetical protein
MCHVLGKRKAALKICKNHLNHTCLYSQTAEQNVTQYETFTHCCKVQITANVPSFKVALEIH